MPDPTVVTPGVLGYVVSAVIGSGFGAALIRGYAVQRVHASELRSLGVHEAECTADRQGLNIEVAKIVTGVDAINKKQDEMSKDIKKLLYNGSGKGKK